jgi:hypothetical protein
MLDQIKIASPCSADWDAMEGDERVRFCSECKKKVFNLSAMTRRDAEALLRKTNGDLCTRLYRRADGKVLTADCPVGLSVKIARVRRRVGWALAGAMGLSTAWAQDTASVSGLMRNANGSVAAKVAVVIKGDGVRVETITDELGTFGATDLAPGKYLITAGDSHLQPIELKAGDAVELVVGEMGQIMGGPTGFKRKPWWRRLL